VPPLRVVVDPNVLVSVLIGKRLIALRVLFYHADFQVMLDEPLIKEFDEMAKRTKFRKYFPTDMVDFVIDRLREGGDVVATPRTIEKICRDPDDDYLLALCKSAKADVLLTGDDDLLVLKKHGRTRIMNARAFVKEFLGGK
jgi:putative PIN family toxin of toxin-antitoxin system